MKFTSILFALVASLFLVESTLAMPAPKCGMFKCRAAKNKAFKKVMNKKKIKKLKGVQKGDE
jgi:hypothetical protein